MKLPLRTQAQQQTHEQTNKRTNNRTLTKMTSSMCAPWPGATSFQSNILVTPPSTSQTQKPSLNYTVKDNRVKWIEANNHFRSGDFGRARSAYTCALDGAAQKDLVTILSNRAECYLRMGLKQQAKSDVENALRLNPGHKKSQSRHKRCGGKTHTSCSDARAERDGGRCCLASMSLRLGERANSRGQTTSSVGETHAH